MNDLIRQESSWDSLYRKVIDRAVSYPAARATYAETSHIAAAEHTASGKRATNIAKVVDLVRANPGRTSAELASLSDLTRHEVARRLPEAEKACAVRKGPRFRCTVNGTLAVVWWPAA